MALSLESALNGDLIIDGAVYTVGDNAVSVNLEKEIEGDVLLSGAITAKGAFQGLDPQSTPALG